MVSRFFSTSEQPEGAPRSFGTGDAARVALLVGMGAYRGARLANPAKDVALISAALKDLGFEVELVVDAGKSQLETAMVRFGQRLERAGPEGIGFFYFAGHGIQFRGANYLVPVDAEIPETRYLRSGAVPVDYLVEGMADCRPLATAIVIDACRDNNIRPSEGGLTQGLGAVEQLPDGTVLVFSTAAGEVAEDGEAGNSPYAVALAGRLSMAGQRLDEVFLGASGDVAAMTGNRQRPAVFLQGAIAPVVLNGAPAEAMGPAGPLDRRPPPNAIAAVRPPAPGPVPRLFENVPPRDLNFTGREAGLAALQEAIGADAPPDAIGQAVIHGMAGIGKTAFAAEYAYRQRESYSGLWWAPAEQRELLVESLARLAVAIDPGLTAEADRERQILAGFRRLAQMKPPFLLVFDNVDSPEVVRNLLPPAGIRLVMTSRWADWGGRAAEIDLQTFDPEAAAEFLQKRAGRDDPVGARRLAAALGHLPLALDHAGAYCRATAASFGAYAERIDARLQRAPKGVAYPASIAATFGLAIDKAALEHPAAETLLGLFAHLAPEKIPLSLVGEDLIDEDDRTEALAALFAVSLIEYDQLADGSPAVNLHRLIQAAMRVRLQDGGQTGPADQVVAALVAAFPDNAQLDPGLWPACATLMPHVLATRDLSRWTAAAEPAAAELFHRAGRYLFGRGAYRDAEPFYRRAIASGEAQAGRDDPQVGRRINDLAQLLATAGRFDEAEPLFREVIASGEARLGRHHLDIAARLNNLARLLNDTGRRQEAEPLYREAIAINDAAGGSSAVHAVAWRNNLGILLNEAGRNDEAEPVYREAIAIGERLLGRRHHEVARCFNNLGRVLWRAGRLAEAEAMARESLAISVESLGPDHPIYARQQHSLAQILTDAGRTDEALEAVTAALEVHEATLGETHPWTRDSATTFVELAHATGDRAGAEAVAGRFGLHLPADG